MAPARSVARMTTAQKLAVRLSEVREKLNQLSGKDELTDEEQSEMRTLSGEYPALEARHRAAMIAESAEEAAAGEDTDSGDGEDGERRELRSRSRLSRYVGAALDGVPVDGAEAELSAAAGCPGSVPLELFEARAGTGDPERRAVTPAPATTDENLAGIVPAIFDRSAAAWLGMEMPSVPTGDAGYPVLSTSLTGGPVAKSAEADESAGAFTVTMAQPRRISGAFRFTVEDAARLSGMEAALRANISAVLSDALDNQTVNGSGTADGTLNGLLAILTDPAAPAADAEDFGRYVAAAASHVDGLFAVDLAGVRQLVGVQTYGHMAGTFRSDSDSMTAEAWAMTRTGGVRTSRRIAAPASSIQQAIVRRSNPAGDRVAVMPVWQGLQMIRDPYTNARKGEVGLTALMLVGDVIVLRAGAFVQDSYRLA